MASRSALFVGLDGSGNGMTPADGRRALAAMYGNAARPLQVPSVTQSSSNMQITVAQNVWQLPDPTDAASTFISAMDSFVVTPAAGPSSGSRIDSVVIKQDNPQNGDSDPYSTPSLIAGTTSSPAIPAGYYEVARVTVPAGASNAAACTVQFMNGSGLAPLPLQAPSTTALPAGTIAGQRATAAGIDYRWNGSVWQPWDCDWIAFNAVPSGLSAYSTNYCEYRYKAGQVLYRGSVYLNGGATVTGNVIIPTPTVMHSRAVNMAGRFVGIHVSDSNRVYSLSANRYSSTQFVLAYQAGSPLADASIDGTHPVVWAGSDTFNWEMEYDPA